MGTVKVKDVDLGYTNSREDERIGQGWLISQINTLMPGLNGTSFAFAVWTRHDRIQSL